jgi:microcystin degradation protein MlrC
VRLALIHIVQETNDFNPVLTTLADFQAFGLHEGEDIARHFGEIGQIGGHYAVIRESGLEVETVPIIRAWAVAGGRISREAFDFFQEKIRIGLEAIGPIDGLVLHLHGACAAEGVDDVEGEQAELCRQILGPDVPILLGLDHHANVTHKIMANCTAIVGHRTQPHDVFDTGKVGTEVLLRILTGKLKPVMAWRKIPLLSHQEQFLTSKGPMKIWFDRARAIEADPRVLQASNYPMQPWLDVAEGGWSTIVAWSMRDDFQMREAVSVDEAVRAGDAAERGMIVLSDTGDTVFGGAAGDSNLILESILRQGTKSRTLIPLISPQAVATLVAAGEGAQVTLPLGGDAAIAFFKPLTVTGRVRKIGGGPVRLDYNHQPEVDMGRVVVFDVGPVTLLISELRGVAGNVPGVYEAFGIDLGDYKMAVLKTASNFQYFAPITSQVIRADTRGPGQSDVFTLPWQRIPRPVYPLETISDWRAHSSQPGAGTG